MFVVERLEECIALTSALEDRAGQTVAMSRRARQKERS